MTAVLVLGVRELVAQMQPDGRTRQAALMVAGTLQSALIVALVWFFPWAAIVLIALDLILIWTLFHQGLTRAHAAWGASVLLAAGIGFLPKLQSVLHDRGAWILWICAVTALADVGQYIAGTTFGKAKVAPKASPGKTWAGLVGGLCVSMLSATVLGSLMSLATLPVLALLGVAIGLAGFFGDISMSACKRMMSIKDFSSWVPGHGGLLDRVDSLILSVPSLFVILSLIPAFIPIN